MIGETILHYKILEKLGEGGMGTVYKAQDTKLERFVALKFLPTQLISTDEQKARFIQEAKAASAMNHPNVCTIHDIQEYNGQLFIVMEFIDGVTLRNNKQNLSEKRILDVAIQISEGLAAAHEKGIVHRDIKPENIMIRKDGIVQIMDFGLAKLFSTGNESKLTKLGTTMGTIGYMSPEQVQGLDVDHRTDIFSLGVVLYEMLAGESPFKGMHETAIMYEIVNVDASPISTIKEGIDPQLDQIVLECLEKDKDERCQSAKELARNLRKQKRESSGSKASRIFNVNTQAFQNQLNLPTGPKSSGSITIEAFNKRFDLSKFLNSFYVSWGLVALLILLVLYFTFFTKSPSVNLITATTSILPPAKVFFNNSNGGDISISNNGKMIAFVGNDSLGNSKLWVRPINSLLAREFPETNGADYPFWSYDDRYIAYFKGRTLMKIEINVGSPLKICDVESGRGGSWNQDDKIVYAPASTGGLFLVPANGGVPVEIVKPDTLIRDQSLRFPFFLPDGKHFIYSIENLFSGSSPEDVVKIGSVDSDVDVTLFNGSTNVQYADGHIFYVRQNTLIVQGFDPDNFKLLDDIQTISADINYFDARIKASFSVSNAGNLIYQSKVQISTRTGLIDRKGNVKEYLFEKQINNRASFSPDNKKIVLDALDDKNNNSDIWVYDLTRKVMTKITFNLNFETSPVWSPNGQQVSFNSNRSRYNDIYVKNADGTGDDSLIYKSDNFKYPVHWSSDGNYILVNSLKSKTIFDIETIQLNNKNNVETFLSTIFAERGLQFSKNMKWILYESNESGNFQAYVRPFKGSQGRWQITTNGFLYGFWAKDDQSIYYIGNDFTLYQVKIINSGTSLTFDTPKPLFNLGERKILNLYDVTNNGENFLVEFSTGTSVIPPLTYIQNWKGLLAK